MADAYSTGADTKGDDLRRRAAQHTNGSARKSYDTYDDKKSRAVWKTILVIVFSKSNHRLQKPQGVLEFLDEYEFVIAPIVFTFLAFFTRMWRIGLSNIVTWDEAQYV